MAGLDRTGEVIGQGFLGAHHEQHAAIAGEGVDVIGEVGGNVLLAVEDAVLAHAMHAVGVPQGKIAQVDAYGEIGQRLVVDGVAGHAAKQCQQRQEDGKTVHLFLIIIIIIWSINVKKGHLIVNLYGIL